jgi:hypothetical protein
VLIAIKLSFGKLVFYTFLSVADLLLTRHLLDEGGGEIYESNPVASWWLASYGWMGLVSFKFAMVALVDALSVFIAAYRPKTSRRILLFACTVTALVVAYSAYLSTTLLD